MTSYTVFCVLTSLIIGVVIGVVLTSLFHPKLRLYNTLKKETDTMRQQLVNQKQMLVKHFARSAELLDKMAKDFRRLYQHTAENSTSLLVDVDICSPQSTILDFDKDEDSVENLKAREQPKDYSNNPSGLLKK